MRPSEIERIKLKAYALVSMVPICAGAAITVLFNGINGSFAIAVFGASAFFVQGRFFLLKAEKELGKLDSKRLKC